jgi:aryl-alcohol dehydrogenase-like predicted oxidoreductase
VSTRAARLPRRYDTSYPDVQRKLEFADRLEQVAAGAGLSLVHLALGFVLAHPAVTSAIVGPRTMEHLESQLGAQELQLSADVLARIDEIVPPGTNVNPLDAGWRPPWLDDPAALRA